MTLKVVCAILAVLQLGACANYNQSDEFVGLLIGGLGGGIDSELITEHGVCDGGHAKPPIPGAQFGSIFGWFAAVHTNHVQKGEPGDLLLCGGKILQEYDTCHRLELGASRWKPDDCTLSTERTNAAMFTTMDGKAVVSGGYSSRAGWLKDVEVLENYESTSNSNSCEWKKVGEIPGNGVYNHCALQFDEETFVFIGGNTWNNEGQYDIADVYKYNIKTGDWTKGKDIPVPRQSHGCIKTTVNGKEGIMVAGGFCNGNPSYASCQQLRITSTAFYHVHEDVWEELRPLNKARDGLTLHNIQGTIMAIGGEYRGKPVKEIEAWSGTRWEVIEMELLQGITRFASVQIPSAFYNC